MILPGANALVHAYPPRTGDRQALRSIVAGADELW
jgi:hypothetical protein